MMKLSRTLEDRVTSMISMQGMTFGHLKELFPETDLMALQKCVRELARTGVITMEPQLLMNSTYLNANRLTPLDIADDVYKVIPPGGITWKDLKMIFQEMRYGDLIMKVFILQVVGLIETTPKQTLGDDTIITKTRSDDKVISFLSRRSQTV